MPTNEPIAPVQPHEIAREVVLAVSRYGDKLELQVPSTAARDVKRSIERQLAGLQVTALAQNGAVLRDCDHVDAGQQVEFSYLLQGGAAAFSTVTSIPEALSIKILMYKCGIQNLPDFDDWWCKNKCCCIHEECGLKDFWTTQCFCIKCLGGGIRHPLPIPPHAVKGFPELLTVSCLCFTCGIEEFPDFAKDDWCQGYMCCCYNNCGPKDCLNVLQILCCKLTC